MSKIYRDTIPGDVTATVERNHRYELFPITVQFPEAEDDHGEEIFSENEARALAHAILSEIGDEPPQETDEFECTDPLCPCRDAEETRPWEPPSQEVADFLSVPYYVVSVVPVGTSPVAFRIVDECE